MSNQLQITGGGKVRNLEGVITGTSGVLSSVPLGAANGVATLDSGGKVPVSQLPSSVVTYLGTWNAATNTPTLVNGIGDAGDMYLCNVAGTVNFGAGPVTFAVGDWVLYGSGTWQKSNGQNGTVTSVGLSTNGGAITIGNSPITTSGVISANFNGTNLQYVNGAGNLTTFPILTGYVPYTGATQDVDLGAFSLNGKSLHIKGTAGNGHLGLKHQSAAATGNANESLIYADSLGDLGWQNANLYLSKFITSANTANRSYTFPNATGTIALTSDISYPVTSVFGRTGAVVATSGDYTTTQVTEGTNLYYTDTRARLALSFVAGSGAYNSTTGVITIPTNNNQITNGAAYITLTSLSAGTGISYNNTTGVITNSAPDQTVSLTAGAGISVSGTYPSFTIASTITQYTDALARAAISLTTTGTSGAATYNNTTGVLNIPQYTDQFVGTVTSVAALTIGTTGTDLSSSVANSTTTPVITLNVPTASATNRGALSSADWTTFNNKQSALTNPVTGTGTTNYLPKFTGTSTIGNSAITDDGSSITLGLSQTTFGTTGSKFYVYPAFSTNLNLLQNYNGSAYTTEEHRASDYSFKIGTTAALTIASTGAATFSSQLTASTARVNGRLFTTSDASFGDMLSTTGVLAISYDAAGQTGYITSRNYTTSTNTPLVFTSSAATFSSSVTAGGVIQTSGAGAILQLLSGGTTTQYQKWQNDGGNYFVGISNSSGGGLLGSQNPYSFCLVTESARDMSFGTQNTERMRITSGGNVLIGTTTDNTGKLQVNGEIRMYGSTLFRGMSSNTLQLCGGTSSSNVKIDGSVEVVTIDTNGAERMRITSGGNVLIGTTDDGGRLVSYSTNAATQIKAAGTAPAITFSNTVLSPTIGGVLGVATAADQFFTGTASSDMVLANQFTAGALIFGTSNLARMRISVGGNVLMGKTVTGAVLTNGFEFNPTDNYLSICNSTSANYSLYVANTGTSGTRNMVAFYGTSSLVGSITYNGTVTAYNSTSDYRLKQDFKNYNGLDLISAIKTYDYEWKSDKSRMYGVMAHELQEILPYAVTGIKDGKEMQQVDYSKIVPILVKSIQELKLEIETLKNK